MIKGVNRVSSQASDVRDVCWSGGEGDVGLMVVCVRAYAYWDRGMEKFRCPQFRE